MPRRARRLLVRPAARPLVRRVRDARRGVVVTRGRAARVAQSQAFAATLRTLGVDAEALVAPGLTHAEVNQAIGRHGDTAVTRALLAFLRRCVA
ncbi:MAG TPA: hypothetical protein VK306_15110 [Acidimicrobiales bacterium]|nr:hypothetical protein [Acidimicrobiales bacterium]